jgi:1-phosphofructokinase
VVFAPSPLLTVTLESGPPDEIHLHAGGQGVWIARMLATLGCEVRLCTALGGESGDVLRGLIRREQVEVREVELAGPNGSYVHDRRSGERTELVQTAPPALQRHELDELYNLALVEGLDADAVVLAGPDDERVLSPTTYRRMASDLHAGVGAVVVDLAGEFLREAVRGGVTLAKASHEDLISTGHANSDEPQELLRAMRALADDGAQTVVISRAAQPALVLCEGRVQSVDAPRFERVDHRGAGDSMTAGMTAALARGSSVEDAIRLGTAAGALNITRRGLATGERELIERLAERVTLTPFEAVTEKA